MFLKSCLNDRHYFFFSYVKIKFKYLPFSKISIKYYYFSLVRIKKKRDYIGVHASMIYILRYLLKKNFKK